MMRINFLEKVLEYKLFQLHPHGLKFMDGRMMNVFDLVFFGKSLLF